MKYMFIFEHFWTYSKRLLVANMWWMAKSAICLLGKYNVLRYRFIPWFFHLL